jgi:hypothetical protein
VSYLLRVSLPDRPGSLGELASALGARGIDIHTVDVVERTDDGTALDDVLVELPPDRMPDSAVSACHTVPGVQVHYLAPYPVGGSLARDLEVVEAMAHDPEGALKTLVDGLPYLLRYGWAATVTSSGGSGRLTYRSSGAPQTEEFGAPWLPMITAALVGTDAAWLPPSWEGTTLAAAPIPEDPTSAVLVGRPGGPAFLPSEIARLGHLTSLACSMRTTADRNARLSSTG